MIMEPPAIGECVRKAGDFPAGVLLFGIVAETRRGTVRRGSWAWVAKSRDEWLHTLGLSLDRYKRALALLKSLDLVSSRQAWRRGENVTHLRLAEAGESWARLNGLLPDDVVTTYDIPKEIAAVVERLTAQGA